MKKEVCDFPETTDSLLELKDDPATTACIMRDSVTGIPKWFGYVAGYRSAAQILCDHVCKEQKGKDIHVYPILFLWQHYIEIALKSLCISFHLVKFEEGQFPKGHKLELLWQHVRRQIQQHYTVGTKPNKHYDSIGQIIEELCSLTTCDEGFRYPVDKNDAPSLHADFERIDLANVNEQFTKLAFLLGLIAIDLEAHREFANHQISEAVEWANSLDT